MHRLLCFLFSLVQDFTAMSVCLSPHLQDAQLMNDIGGLLEGTLVTLSRPTTTAIATSILIFRICSLPSIFFSQLDIQLWLRTVAIDKEPGISESKSSNLRFGFHGQPPTWNPPLPGAILIARKVGPSLPRWTFVLCTNVTPHGALLKRVHFTLHRVTTTC